MDSSRSGRFGFAALVIAFSMVGATACASAYKQQVGGDPNRILARIYLTDFNTAWQGVLDALKNSRLDVSNREGGFIQTKWTDNTAEKNFEESFGNADAYQKAQYRFKVTVAKGFYNGQNSVKVSVQKEQVVQRDVLEGFHPLEAEPVEENTLLYRIGRVISMRMRIARLEEQKTQKAIEDTGAPGSRLPSSK